MAYILVVDDDLASRMIVRTLLADAGHEVVVADEGDQALVMMRRRLPDIVIADLYMDDFYASGMDGMEFLRRTRRNWPSEPVLVISYKPGVAHVLEMALHLGAAGLLDKVGLTERLDHYPRQLSGGEQQRVAIARAFASRPNVLFADEPTGNLDTRTGQKIIDLLFELNAEFDTTLVLVTHDDRLASRCQRTIEISLGRIIS